MIAGLLPAQEGGISVNGIPLAGLSKSDWAALVGYVPQEALLFSGTIEENVAFGVRRTPPVLSSERFWELAETAQIDEEVRSFPLKEKNAAGPARRERFWEGRSSASR